MWPNSQEFMDTARRLANERALLFSLDEVQSGLCRTGKWFAIEHYGIRPDVVCIAKALGNGFPIAAVWARAECGGGPRGRRPREHLRRKPAGYGGGAKVLEIMQREGLPAKAAALGETLTGALRDLPRVVDVRGMGGMLAAELDGEISKEVAAKASDMGLLVNAITPTALRLTPPLTTSADEVDEAMTILGKALA